jgi:hypothetical protein
MIRIDYLDKKFETRKDVFKYLKENKSDIISLKKVHKNQSTPIHVNPIEKSATEKGLTPSTEITYGSYVYPIINTTNYMDNHDDAHMNGIWNKSISEQQGKVYFVADHKLEIDKIICRPKDVEMMLRDFTWAELGLLYEGMTQALIFKAKLTERSMKAAYEALKANDPVEYSIRMLYVNMCMAIDDQSPEYKEEYADWLKYYPLLANKERAKERGFFFPVIEAKIYKEGSMVIAGSNEATMTYYDLESKNLPPDGTGTTIEEPVKPLRKSIDYKYLSNEFKNLKI